MKKILAIAVCAVIAASFAACDARDGRIDDGAYTANESRKTTSRDVSRTDEGVLHDAASTIGEVGEDIADGADRMGSSVRSNIDDAAGSAR